MVRTKKTHHEIIGSVPEAKSGFLHLSIRLIKDSLGLTPSSDVSVQFVRSVAVSVVALVVDFGGLIILKQVFGVNYLLAATLSFLAGVVVNYALSVTWVFADRKLASKRAEFVIFVIICAVGLAINLAVIGSMVQWFGVDYRLAKIVSTVVVFFWNFIGRKKILY